MTETERPGPPKGIKPHLVVKLKKGWRFEDKRKAFVSPRGREVTLSDDLPRGSKIVYMVPELAKKKSLTGDEKNLARYVHVILPKGKSPADYLPTVGKWACVDDVQPPRDFGLPS